jgi:hypothetical protein
VDKQGICNDWDAHKQQSRRLLLDLVFVLAGPDLASWVENSLDELDDRDPQRPLLNQSTPSNVCFSFKNVPLVSCFVICLVERNTTSTIAFLSALTLSSPPSDLSFALV